MAENQPNAGDDTPQDDLEAQELDVAPLPTGTTSDAAVIEDVSEPAPALEEPVATAAATETATTQSDSGGGSRTLMIIAIVAIVLAVVAIFLVLRDRNSGSTPEPEPTPVLPGAPQPVIVFPPEAQVGDNVTFDGSQSQPGDNPIAGFQWAFGDGATAESEIALHAYAEPGRYNVTLTVVDSAGIGAIGGPVEIIILPAAGPEPTPTLPTLPQPVIVAPASAQVGQQITFDGSQSQPGDNPIATYAWDFGDGGRAAGQLVNYVYNTPGQYNVTLTVTDQAGYGNVAGPVQITISPVAVQPTVGVAPQPIISAPETGIVGNEVTFDGSQSRPGSSPIVNYTWSFGDGGSASGPIVSYAYQQPGLYSVTLTITGEDGLTTPSGPVEINITASSRDD